MNNIVNLYQNQKLTLSQRWDIASEIWHREGEKKVLKNLINHIELKKNDTIIDVACGTGFHSLFLNNLGINVIATDIDKGNLDKFMVKLKRENVFIPLIQADWINIDEVIDNKFDAVFCLGSSITYFESWNEYNHINLNNRETKIIEILKNFKKLLYSNGTLVIGYSRHYPIEKDYNVIDHGKLTLLNGTTYYMKWHLFFDWNKKIKRWHCEIQDLEGKDYSFKLESHLYSLEEFKLICESVFENVKIIDLSKNYYDIFFLCK